MIVTERPSTLAPPQSPHVRTPGVHVSSLIRGLAIASGILKPDVAEELKLVEVASASDAWWARLDEVSRLRVALGLAWEEWYIPQLPHVTDHPGEMCVDGIYMTHDGESLDVVLTDRGEEYVPVVHEIKATYKSRNTVGDLRTQWMWQAQTKAYCRSLGTRFCQLHVLFICGDYTQPIKPRLVIYSIEYTQAELDENWALLTDYRDAHLDLLS